MLTNSLCLTPIVGGRSSKLFRTESSEMTTQYNYFLLMGLFNVQGERQVSVSRGEGSGTVSGTHHGANNRASGAQSFHSARGGPNHGRNEHINNRPNVERPNVMELASSRPIVEDFIRYSLEKKGLSWENGQRDVTPSAAQRAMRGLGDELESRFSESINEMVSRLQLTPENGQEKMTTVMDEIFADGVAWGRLAALVEFAGKLSVCCVQQSRPQLVRSIVDWVSNYVDTRLRTWIVENNGWEGFVAFYEDSGDHSPESWSSLKKMFTVGAAAVGLLTLGALWKS